MLDLPTNENRSRERIKRGSHLIFPFFSLFSDFCYEGLLFYRVVIGNKRQWLGTTFIDRTHFIALKKILTIVNFFFLFFFFSLCVFLFFFLYEVFFLFHIPKNGFGFTHRSCRKVIFNLGEITLYRIESTQTLVHTTNILIHQ